MAFVGQWFLYCLSGVLLLSGASLGSSRPSAIVLENNEYRNILVAINDNVQDGPQAGLVQKIKDAFTKGSAFLYSATQQRAVFRDVTILVPAKWSNQGAYQKATTQVFSNADVIFSAPLSPAPPPRVSLGTEGDEADGWAVAGQPAATKSYAGCGHQGVRVTLTTDMLTDPRMAHTLGPPEKFLVHEFAHFRYGVFDEYALDGEPQFYFSPISGQLEGVRCTEMIKGILQRTDPSGRREYCRELDNRTGLYPEGCTFLPYPAGPNVLGIEASIMDHVSIGPMSKFCDDDQANKATRHNYDAPSRHNRLCGHRSTWDVISHSDDFGDGANAARPGLDTTPVFTVVQASADRRLVLALDTSASMAEDQKMTRMKQAVGAFVKEGLAPATVVGLTTFSDAVKVVRELRPLNTSEDRQSFVEDLPTSQQGATDFSQAVSAAAQVLQQQHSEQGENSRRRRDTHVTPSQHAGGGHVVVMTDGQETQGGDVRRLIPGLRAGGVMVSLVVLGGPPHPHLQEVASQTGGRVYCDNNLHSSTAAMDAFFDMQDIGVSSSETGPIQILSQAQTLHGHSTMQGWVAIDAELGNHTTFLVAYDVTTPFVVVTSPSGRVYNHMYPEYSLDRRLKMVRIRVPQTAQAGRWSFSVTNPSGTQRVSVLVLSSASRPASQPVTLTASLMRKRGRPDLPPHFLIFGEATKGESPVTGLSVKAHVTMPDGSSEQVQLLDNGAGADIVEDDGVYSRYFTKLGQPGLYTVRVTAAPDADQSHCHSDPPQPPTALVQRTVSAGYIVIPPQTSTQPATGSGRDAIDTEAPVRISDLRVVKTSGKNRTVMLSWRASGDDTDRDTASHYKVFVAPSARDLLQRSSLVSVLTQRDVLRGSLTAPKPFGQREYCMLRVPPSLTSNHSYVFTVIAVDEAGNEGEHSNYVTVGLGRVPDVTDRKYWQEGDAQLLVSATQLTAPEDQKTLIAVILGTVTGLLVLVILTSVLVTALHNRKRRDIHSLSKARLQNSRINMGGSFDGDFRDNLFVMT